MPKGRHGWLRCPAALLQRLFSRLTGRNCDLGRGRTGCRECRRLPPRGGGPEGTMRIRPAPGPGSAAFLLKTNSARPFPLPGGHHLSRLTSGHSSNHHTCITFGVGLEGHDAVRAWPPGKRLRRVWSPPWQPQAQVTSPGRALTVPFRAGNLTGSPGCRGAGSLAACGLWSRPAPAGSAVLPANSQRHRWRCASGPDALGYPPGICPSGRTR